MTRVDILVRLSHPNNAADESIKTSVEESENGDLLEDKRKKKLKKLKRREKKVLMLLKYCLKLVEECGLPAAATVPDSKTQLLRDLQKVHSRLVLKLSLPRLPQWILVVYKQYLYNQV